MSANDSPDVFKASPSRGTGVRRMTRRPLMVIFGVFVLVMAVVYYTVLERSDEGDQQKKAAEKKIDPASSTGLFENAPNAGLISAKELPKAAPKPEPAPIVIDAHGIAQPSQPGDVDAYAQEWQQYRQQQGQVRQAQLQAAMSALSASPTVGDFDRRASEAKQGGATNANGVPAMPVAPTPPDSSFLDRVAGLARRASGGLGGGGAGSIGEEADQNNAKRKRGWLDAESNQADYLASGRVAPRSAYEVKTGTAIPGKMIGGINSDLPGQIVAEVSENVWDTATGKHLLIPQNARLVGTYDNQVTRGQSRVLAAWTRIIFPDGSSIDLGMMPGADQGGYAGFSDKTNNHYFKVFGDAMLLSVFSAGIQLSQPQTNNNTNGGGYSSQQIIAGSLGQQLGQAGMQITQKNLNIQPTLEIRPGYTFNVMVTKDMVLPLWHEPKP